MKHIRAFNGKPYLFSLDTCSRDALDHIRQFLASCFLTDVTDAVIVRLALGRLVYEFDDIHKELRATKAGTYEHQMLTTRVLNELQDIGNAHFSSQLPAVPSGSPWPTWEERKQKQARRNKNRLLLSLGINKRNHNPCDKYPEGCSTCQSKGGANAKS